MKHTLNDLAKSINDYCKNFDYFWASGLIKETLPAWEIKDNYNLLCPTAQTFADHYLNS